jgi:hypothetical protein
LLVRDDAYSRHQPSEWVTNSLRHQPLGTASAGQPEARRGCSSCSVPPLNPGREACYALLDLTPVPSPAREGSLLQRVGAKGIRAGRGDARSGPSRRRELVRARRQVRVWFHTATSCDLGDQDCSAPSSATALGSTLPSLAGEGPGVRSALQRYSCNAAQDLPFLAQGRGRGLGEAPIVTARSARAARRCGRPRCDWRRPSCRAASRRET